MAFETILSAIQERATQRPKTTLKFDLGGKQIFIDGKGAANTVSTEDSPADCTIRIAEDDFAALLKGELNPMGGAFSPSGKIKVDGDMSVALKLQSLLS